MIYTLFPTEKVWEGAGPLEALDNENRPGTPISPYDYNTYFLLKYSCNSLLMPQYTKERQ